MTSKRGTENDYGAGSAIWIIFSSSLEDEPVEDRAKSLLPQAMAGCCTHWVHDCNGQVEGALSHG